MRTLAAGSDDLPGLLLCFRAQQSHIQTGPGCAGGHDCNDCFSVARPSTLALTWDLAVQEVTICEDCFSVSGPSSPSVAFFNQVDSSNSTYQLMVDWEPSYRGPITVGLQAARCGPARSSTFAQQRKQFPCCRGDGHTQSNANPGALHHPDCPGYHRSFDPARSTVQNAF